jgi:hypothetical protein
MPGFAVWPVFAVDEIVRVVVAHEDDIAAPAAVATVGSAPGFELLAAEADAPAPAVPRLHLDDTLVDKHDGVTVQKARSLPIPG